MAPLTTGLQFERRPAFGAPVWQVEHAGTSGTFRPIGESCKYLEAIGHARQVRSNGYAVRIMYNGQLDENATADANECQ